MTDATQRVYLHSKFKAGFGYEVVAFNKATNRALLWSENGFINDDSLHIGVIKRCYTMNNERPPHVPERPTNASTEAKRKELTP